MTASAFPDRSDGGHPRYCMSGITAHSKSKKKTCIDILPIEIHKMLYDTSDRDSFEYVETIQRGANYGTRDLRVPVQFLNILLALVYEE